MFKKIALSFIIALVFLVSNTEAYTYDITYWDDSVTGLSVSTDPVSFQSNQATAVNIAQTGYLRFNVSSPPDTYTLSYLTPFTVTHAVATGPLTHNYSCLDLGTAEKSYSSDRTEGRNTITHDGSATSSISTGNQYIVSADERYLQVTQHETDSESYLSNMYFRNICLTDGASVSNQNITRLFNSDNYGVCLTLEAYRTPLTYTSCGAGIPKYYGFVVFNSTAGNVTFNSLAPDNTGQTRHILYPLNDPSTIIASCVNSAGCLKTAILESNRLYVVGVGAVVNVGGADETPRINVTIDLGIANYVCPAWSECDESTGTQTRTCIDDNGFQPDRIELQACSLIILENATFGFENSTKRSDVDICIPTWFFGCGYTVKNDLEVDVPENWVITYAVNRTDYFLQMTDEWATEGTRSLKMWVIPSSEGEPNSDATTCINSTSAKFPTVYKPINDTFLLSYDVTFPAENMLISYDIKSCPAQVLKHDSLATKWSPNVTLIEYCPKKCYSESCETSPKGNYVFNIQDVNNSISIIGNPFYGVANALTTSVSFPLEGVTVGINYNVVFGTIPENPLDRSGQCVMIDNVRYEVLEQPITHSLVPDCVSRCIGTGYYKATRLSNGECSLTITKNSVNCVDSVTREKIEALEPYCVDSDTASVYEERRGEYINVDCSGTDVCYDGYCIDQADDVITIASSLYLPHQIVQDVLTEWTIVYEGNEIVWFFNSIFMYINYLAIGLGIGVSMAVRGNSNDAKDFFIPFIVIVLVVIISSTFGGFYPLEIGLPLIVAIGLLLWKTMEGMIGRKGSG